ncbi:hypothetical protein GCM10020331_098800 [Ectobacillus funiculus]
MIKRFKKRYCSDAGVKISSVLPVQQWSSPNEEARQAAVRNWKRCIEITSDLGVDLMNSEFAGDKSRPLESEAAFVKSMEELLPIFLKERALNLIYNLIRTISLS